MISAAMCEPIDATGQASSTTTQRLVLRTESKITSSSRGLSPIEVTVLSLDMAPTSQAASQL